MLRRAILMTAAVSALGAAAFVCVVALAFALFAALAPALGNAGAAAAVAGAAVLLILLMALSALVMAKPPPAKPAETGPDLTGKLFGMARDRPLFAAAAIAATAVIALKNPQITGALISAFMSPKEPKT
jgi:hypothetical protein